MILDPDVCVYDADINDAYINDPWPTLMSDACVHDAGFFSGRTNGRTDKPILGVGCCFCFFMWWESWSKGEASDLQFSCRSSVIVQIYLRSMTISYDKSFGTGWQTWNCQTFYSTKFMPNYFLKENRQFSLQNFFTLTPHSTVHQNYCRLLFRVWSKFWGVWIHNFENASAEWQNNKFGLETPHLKFSHIEISNLFTSHAVSCPFESNKGEQCQNGY